jgi:hypothetical protein
LYENGYWAGKWEDGIEMVLEEIGREVVDNLGNGRYK